MDKKASPQIADTGEKSDDNKIYAIKVIVKEKLEQKDVGEKL